MTSAPALADDVATQLRLVRLPIETSRTLPTSVYSRVDVWEREKALLFHSGWVGVGRVDRWDDAGAFATFQLGDVPVAVVRDESNGLRAYNNSCSHRGSQILLGEGSCNRMRCRFHFWTYSLDGRLVAAPNMNETPGFDKDEHGLVEFAVAERDGFVFVSIEPEPPAIDEWLGSFAALHAPWDAARLRTGRRRSFTVNSNWKTFCEVFNEYYHLPYVHPDSINDTYLAPEPGDEPAGNWASQFGSTQGTGGLLDDAQHEELPTLAWLPAEQAAGVRYSWIYPNTVVAYGRDALWMYTVWPEGPELTRCEQVVAFPQESLDRDDFEVKAAEYYRRFDVALDEDIPMLEEQQSGMRSPFTPQGRYAVGLEPSVARFAAWYSETMQNQV